MLAKLLVRIRICCISLNLNIFFSYNFIIVNKMSSMVSARSPKQFHSDDSIDSAPSPQRAAARCRAAQRYDIAGVAESTIQLNSQIGLSRGIELSRRTIIIIIIPHVMLVSSSFFFFIFDVRILSDNF